MLSTESGMTISVSVGMPANAAERMYFTELGITTEVNFVSSKTPISIEVIDFDLMSVKIFDLEYGSKEKKTTINALTNDELLTIIDWMVETIQNGYWD